MEFKELTPKYFDVLLEKGFSSACYSSRGLVEDYFYEKSDYGIRISHDIRDKMVSIYAYSVKHKDSRFSDHPKEINLWSYLRKAVKGKIELRPKTQQGIEGDLEQGLGLVIDYFELIDSQIDSFLEAR